MTIMTMVILMDCILFMQHPFGMVIILVQRMTVIYGGLMFIITLKIMSIMMVWKRIIICGPESTLWMKQSFMTIIPTNISTSTHPHIFMRQVTC